MKRRIGLVALVAAVGLGTSLDLLACGDKFLIGTRGTRYQRPKNARAASVLIYANPASGLDAVFSKMPVEPVLKREGHRFTTVATPGELSAALAGSRFDVVLAASADAPAIEEMLAGKPNSPIVLAVCSKGQAEPPAGKAVSCALKAPPKEYSLLEAIDKAVERHDHNSRQVLTRS